MTKSWHYRTKRGTFSIRRSRHSWCTYLDGDLLDCNYASPVQAAYEVATGVGTWPSFGDPSTLGIPEDIADWTPGP